MKELILEKSMSLFWKYGIKSITMDDLAREAGISKKTIYQFFKDKNELVYECVKVELEGEECDILKIAKTAEDAIGEVIMISQHVKKKLDGMNPCLIIDLQRHQHKAWELFQTAKNESRLKMIVENLERGKKEGLYRSEINSIILAKWRVESILISFNTDIFPPSEYNIRDLHLEFLDHFLHGVVTPAGMELVKKYKNLTLPNF